MSDAVNALALAEPFPKSMLRFHQGKKLTYVPVAEVIARMNRVLGVAGWSSEVVRIWREPDHPDWVLAHVRVSAIIDGVAVTHDGVGGQQVKKLRSGAGVVDLGDEFKGAMSDAFKKACQGFGVGLELARTDEAIAEEVAQQSDNANAPAADNPMVDAVTTATWQRFAEGMAELSSDEKRAVKEWWDSTYGEYGNPDPRISTEDQIVDAVATIDRVRLNVTA